MKDHTSTNVKNLWQGDHFAPWQPDLAFFYCCPPASPSSLFSIFSPGLIPPLFSLSVHSRHKPPL